VPPGTYVIRASKAGWRSAQRTITVTEGSNPSNINFVLQPEHVFGRGLLLVSLPYDFPGEDAAGLFNQPQSTFKSAYWLTEQARYAIYPEAPAREFRLGKGMFVRFNTPAAFARAGSEAPNQPFRLAVKSGWNMIGAVRKVRIEWLRVKVQPASGGELTMQEAMDRGIVQNGLFGYIDGYFRSDFLDPFNGYFMRAFQDCTLIIPVDNSSTSVTDETRRKVARMPVPSVEEVAAGVAAAGLAPGRRAAATPAAPSAGVPSFRMVLSSLFGDPVRAIKNWYWRPGLG